MSLTVNCDVVESETRKDAEAPEDCPDWLIFGLSYTADNLRTGVPQVLTRQLIDNSWNNLVPGSGTKSFTTKTLGLDSSGPDIV